MYYQELYQQAKRAYLLRGGRQTVSNSDKDYARQIARAEDESKEANGRLFDERKEAEKVLSDHTKKGDRKENPYKMYYPELEKKNSFEYNFVIVDDEIKKLLETKFGRISFDSKKRLQTKFISIYTLCNDDKIYKKK